MQRITGGIRKIVVALVGFPVLVIGIILIPLPGPGLLVCLLAFLILSTEFDWASKYYDKSKQQIADIYAKSKEKQQKYLDKIDDSKK